MVIAVEKEKKMGKPNKIRLETAKYFFSQFILQAIPFGCVKTVAVKINSRKSRLVKHPRCQFG